MSAVTGSVLAAGGIPGVLVALLVMVLAVLLIVIVSYNRFVSQRQEIDSAWATVDAEIQRRHVLVPQLVEVVRAAAAHEREVLEGLIAADERLLAVRDDRSLAVRADDAVRAALGRVLGVGEAWPQLRTSENFLSLQSDLAMIEDRIAAARRYFNTRVLAYNARIDAFPSSLVAARGGFVKAHYFGVSE